MAGNALIGLFLFALLPFGMCAIGFLIPSQRDTRRIPPAAIFIAMFSVSLLYALTSDYITSYIEGSNDACPGLATAVVIVAAAVVIWKFR